MPSMKCHQCNKAKKCSLYVDPSIVTEQRPKGMIVYLCSPCARALGYK